MSGEAKQPYIGAPVTLISSLDVRYEGILFTIDPNESTVALQEVKCLGTEDRQTGEKAIPASDTVYEFIIFRGENIKSICCSEGTEKPKERSPINDPSILHVGPTEKSSNRRDNRVNLSHLQPSHHPHDKYMPHRSQYNDGRNNWQPRNQYRRNYHQGGYRRDNRDHRGYQRRDNRGYRRDNRRGRYRGRPYQRQDPQFAPGDAKFLIRSRDEEAQVESLDENFDFTTANARFDKDEFGHEAVEPKREPEPAVQGGAEEAAPAEEQEGDEKKDEEVVVVEEVAEVKRAPEKEAKFQYRYNPDNFFDELDTGASQGPSRDMKQRRKKDAETFGKIAEHYSPKIFRRRRYKRRGGNRYQNNRRYYNNQY